ncbi:MAG: hypothetical protein RL410_405 [Actinomycetota bacterium]
MANKQRLLATDLDGTFLASDGRVTVENKAALHATHESDLEVIFVTGRPARWLRGVADAAEHYNLIVGANGGFIADMRRMEVIQANTADGNALQHVVEKILQKFPDAHFAIERSFVGMPIASSTGLEYKEMNVSELSDFEFAVTPGYETRWKISQTIPVATIDELITQSDITKLLIKPSSPEGWNSDTWLAEVQPLVGDLLQTTHASQDVVLAEVSAKGVTKATALAHVAAEMSIAARNVTAVGDMPNDVPMLEWAGEAWAVANAHDEVLAVTTNRLPHHDESPVAQLIHDLLSRN